MTNIEIISQYYSIVKPNGVTASARYNETYWRRYGHGNLYDLIVERTDFLHKSKSYHIQERIAALEQGLTSHPVCVTCGAPVMIVERRKFSEFCSKECVHKDPNISSKRKAAFKSYDKVAAKKKRSDTMLQKYGVQYNSQRTEIKDLLSKSKIKYSNPTALLKLESYDWMLEHYITNKRTLSDISKELNVFYGTVRDYCVKHGFDIRQITNYSVQEIEVGDYIRSLNFDCSSDREVLNGLEIDVFVKDKNFGIELDGAFWHSYNRFESKEEKHRHLHKTSTALEKKVSIVHVFDVEWLEKKSIVKSIIASRLGVNKKIYARKCEVREIDSKTAKEFIERTHIQGFSVAKVNLGLFYYDELVMVMNLGEPRFNKRYSWELIRMSSELDVTVVGGASKIFKHFIDNYNVGSGVLSYCDRRFGEGKVYTKIGFIQEGSTGPGYYWTDGNKVWNRTKFQKHKLKDLLPNFQQDLSEAENMFNSGYRRLWDCGSNIFVYR